MNAPLYNSLNEVIDKKTLRMHMPGHKGKGFYAPFNEIYPYDFTETPQTGNLYEEEGAIRQAEILASEFYESTDCHFLTGGSTQGILAMLGVFASVGGEVLLDRSAHKSVASACALFDLKPHFVYPDMLLPYGIGGKLDLKKIEIKLKEHENIKAMLIVSPNYYGIIQDIEGIAKLCHLYGVKLLVDAAHGAHFPAIDLPSPIKLGADAAVLSAHKTLPAMGQGAYLIIKDREYASELRQMESTVSTSSPSYPIMMSLDMARAWLSETDCYKKTESLVINLKKTINEKTPFTALDISGYQDTLRLTVCAATAGITGHKLYDMLENDYRIVCEMADDRNIVCIITGMDSKDDIKRLENAILSCANGLVSTKPDNIYPLPQPEARISVRKAWFSKKQTVKIQNAQGKICARPVTPYPPGIPILFPGEEIQAKHIEYIIKRCYNSISHVQICANEMI